MRRRDLARRFHPNNGSEPNEAQMSEINAACDVLENEDKRAAYDKELSDARATMAARKREKKARAEREKHRRDAAEADAIAEMFADNSPDAAPSDTTDSAGQAPPPPVPPKQGAPAPMASPPPPPTLPARKRSFNFWEWLGNGIAYSCGATIVCCGVGLVIAVAFSISNLSTLMSVMAILGLVWGFGSSASEQLDRS